MNSSFLYRLADRLILRPSRNLIDPEGRRRELVSTPNGVVEVWVSSNQRGPEIETATDRPFTRKKLGTELDLIALKFPGTAGRAERGGPHPLELIPELKAEIWTVNPVGYGGSEGRASLATTAATCEAVWNSAHEQFPATPIFLIGNSLGCLSALYLAARKNVAGVYLRNPVPVQQLIASRRKYNWWNFGLAGFIAKQVPGELDAVQNSKLSTSPMLMVSSERDRICPWEIQDKIWSGYSGYKELIVLKGAEHHEGAADFQIDDYRTQTADFLARVFQK